MGIHISVLAASTEPRLGCDIFRRGINVFAPQLLLWSEKQYKPGYDRNTLDARLKNVGSSVTALEIYALMRGVDYFEQQEWVTNIGMVGLSYGGYYTQLTAALDTRIKAAISCSFFCDATHWVKPDWSFTGIAECFDYQKSTREYMRILEICGGNSGDWLEYTVFDGDHEFYKEDHHIKKLIECLRKEGKE